ncbi:MAG: hypothetical protein COT85_04875 [Chlamydiae bacterium CG10_big_fil_rev_8_21_14_0_10_42_34]|nr:MAG: hypothetical protein COT85_04875 [Chlamydiae bacterium CG10_big_fil_rev_8_21_14_0_10_42_34]
MSTREEKKITIQLPRLKWRAFLTIRFLLLLGAIFFASFVGYWYQNIRPYLWLSHARIEAFSTVLSSDAAGRIAEMGPQEGERVKKGQPLFSLDRDLVLAKQSQAKFILDSLNKQVEIEKERMGKAMEAYLTASNDLDLGIGSPDVIQKQLSMMDEAQEKSEIALSKIADAEKDLRLINLELKKMTTVAPFDAVILKKAKNPGAVVSFGDPVYTLCKSDPLWIETEIRESDIGQIKVGTKARICLTAYPDKELVGAVSYIGPATVAKSSFLPISTINQVIPIKISIENQGIELKPGLSAKVALKVR